MSTGSPFVVRGAHRRCSELSRRTPGASAGGRELSRRRRTTERVFPLPAAARRRTAVAAVAQPSPPFIRLRYVLAFASVALLGFLLVPRATAYWQLHAAATHFANYGLCMVGPTGPALLRERPEEFWRLVRRRVVASDPDIQPFAHCVESLEGFRPSDAQRAAHEASAGDFAEYEAFAGEARPTLAIADLTVTDGWLEELTERAYPLARDGLEALVRPSRNARAVPHPVELPVPGVGRGLPRVGLSPAAVLASDESLTLVTGRDANLSAYASRDGGLTWSSLPSDDQRIESVAGLCADGLGVPAYRLVYDDSQLRLESWLDGSVETSFPVSSSDRQLQSFTCDRTAALIATTTVDGGDLSLKLCKHVHRCRDLDVPVDLRTLSSGARFSLARAGGVSVLALARKGIVRVLSSRDDGESWAPSTVAYDAGDAERARAAEPMPDRLLSLGDRVLLYAGASSPGGVYPALISDDFGASWRAAGEPRDRVKLSRAEPL